MKDETGGIAIQEFVGLKQKMYLFLVVNSEHKEAIGVNINAVATIGYNEYTAVLLNNKCIMNRI